MAKERERERERERGGGYMHIFIRIDKNEFYKSYLNMSLSNDCNVIIDF